jgi:hypothetical protein
MYADPAPLAAGPHPELEPGLEIERFVGRIGDGLVYLGGLRVSHLRIREYCPAGVTRRDETGRLVAANPALRSVWEGGVRRFNAKAKALTRILDPGVHRVWRVYDGARIPDGAATACLAGAAVQRTLADRFLLERKAAPALVMMLARQLAQALRVVHAKNLLHLDICPETIALVGKQARLTDFAIDPRPYMRALGTQKGLVRTDYAAMELQDGSESMPLGAATDIYAACAVLHRMVAGAPPPRWAPRLRGRGGPLLAGISGYPEPFLEAIRKGLSPEPAARFESAEAWLEAMRLPGKPEGERWYFDAPKPTAPAAAAARAAPAAGTRSRAPLVAGGIVAGIAAAGGLLLFMGGREPASPVGSEENIVFSDLANSVAENFTGAVNVSDSGNAIVDAASETDALNMISPEPAPPPAPTLAGRWRRDGGDPSCQSPATIEMDGSGLTYTRGGVSFPERVVEQNGGEVVTEVVSGPSQGMRFRFRLAPDGSRYTMEDETWVRCVTTPL